MRVVNTSRIPETLTLVDVLGNQTQVVIQPGVQSLPDGLVVSKDHAPLYAAFLSFVSDEDDSVVSLQGSPATAGGDTVHEPESESQPEDDESDGDEEEDE